MRKKICVLTVVLAVLLTGCGTTVPELSYLDNDMAAQYMANELLKNDKEYSWTIDYDHALLEATPTPQPTVAPTPTPATEQDTTDTGEDGAKVDGAQEQDEVVLQSVSLSELYGAKGIKVDAVSYKVENSYGTDYAVCTPSKGNKLVVVQFRVSNSTNKKQRVNFTKNKISASLFVNGEQIGSPLFSIVDGDLQFFNEVLKAKQKKQGVLLFEIDKSMKVSDVEVQFVKGEKKAVTKVR